MTLDEPPGWRTFPGGIMMGSVTDETRATGFPPATVTELGAAENLNRTRLYPVTARRGIVVAGHPLAAAAGARILAAGGNAVDAALATSAVLAVVRPHMS